MAKSIKSSADVDSKYKINPDDNIFKKAWYWHRARQERLKQQRKNQNFAQQTISFLKTLAGAFIIVLFINGLLLASFVVPTGSMENTVMTGDFLFVAKIYNPSTPQVIPWINLALPYISFPGIKDPEKGDVIVFIYPGDRNEVKSKEFQYYLKRCLATAGDTIQIINKKVFVNNIEQELPLNGRYDYSRPVFNSEKWETFPFGKDYTRDNYGPVRVPKEGDTVYLNAKNFREWDIFIEREGHKASLEGTNIMIDGTAQTYYVVEKDYCFGMGDNRDHSADSRFWGFIPYNNVVGTPLIVWWSWQTKDQNDRETTLSQKLKNIRWSRIGTLIN